MTLVNHNGKITGLARLNGTAYEIVPVDHGRQAIVAVDTSTFQDIEDDGEENPDYRPELPHMPRSSHSTIRVMVAVTEDAKEALGDVEGQVALAFALANEGNRTSGVDITFENAGILDTQYKQSSDSSKVLLAQTRDATDPVLGKPIHDFREAHRADLVSTLAILGSSCGRGVVNATKTNAHSIVDVGCLYKYTFGHEIGHGLGTNHERARYDTPRYPPYAHGYQQDEHAPYWRTMMAYSCDDVSCPRLNAWSNPRVTYNGLPMGTAQFEDSARRLNERRELVAAFYPPPAGAISPHASATAQPNDVSQATLVSLNGSGSNQADGGALRYAWSQVSGPAVTLDNSTQAVAIAQIPDVSTTTTFTFQLVVSNIDNLSDSTRVTVTARPDSNRPQAQINGADTVQAGQSLTLFGSGSTGLNLHYEWSAPGFTPASSSAHNVTLTAPTSSGPRTVSLTVTDAAHHADTAQHIINVIGSPLPGQCGDYVPWDAAKAYATYDEKVSYLGMKYQQNFYNINTPPDRNSAAFGEPWRPFGACP